MSREPMAATDGSQLTAYSLRPSDSGPSAVSRKPTADVSGQVYEQFLGKVIKLTDGHRAKVEEKPQGLAPARAGLTSSVADISCV